MPPLRFSSVPRIRIVILPLSFLLGLLLGILFFFFSKTTLHEAHTSNSNYKQTTPISMINDKVYSRLITLDNVYLNVNIKESLRNGCHNPLRLLFIVPSSPYGIARRAAARRTWMTLYSKLPNVTITPKFIIGNKELPRRKKDEIEHEMTTYQDIILLDNLVDSYFNLTNKLLQGLVRVHKNHHFDYLIKCDDDSFVQIDRLVNALHKMGCPPRLYWGYFMGKGFPEYTGKFEEKKWFLCPHFVPYALGGGYVLSWQLVDLVVHLSVVLQLYNNEDVTVGLWMAPFNVQRIHDVRFNTEGHSRGCHNNYIVTHKEKAATLIQKRKNLLSNRTMCLIVREIKPAYIYNWTVSPLLCCQREMSIPIPQ